MEKVIHSLLKKTEEDRVAWLFNHFSAGLNRYATTQWNVEEDVRWELIYQSIYKIEKLIDSTPINDFNHLQSLIYRIFINLLKNQLRDEKRKRKGVTEVELTDENSTGLASKDSAVSPQVTRLNKVLDTFEDWERILLLMRAQEVSYSSIAAYVRKPEKQLKVYYSRLKKKLENQLKTMNDEK